MGGEYKPWPQSKKKKAMVKEQKTAAHTAKDNSVGGNEDDSTDGEAPTKPLIGIKRKLGAALGGGSSKNNNVSVDLKTRLFS